MNTEDLSSSLSCFLLKGSNMPYCRSSDIQLLLWVGGLSVHNYAMENPDGECCPDFSCCNPSVITDQVEREAFLRADDDAREHLCLGFLGVSLSTKNVHVVGLQDLLEE